MREVVDGVAQMTGAKIDLDYVRGYPVAVNHASQTDFGHQGGRRKLPATAMFTRCRRMMGAEDFAYMLEARPGAFIFCGNGDSAGLHHPAYNFNDEAIVVRHVVLDQAGREHAGGVTALASRRGSVTLRM